MALVSTVRKGRKNDIPDIAHHVFWGIFSVCVQIFNFFRSRKKFLTTNAIYHFSRPFNENFKFLKNFPYNFHKILHIHSTPKGAPACAMASKSYHWDVRNTAKISPKMAKNCPYDSSQIFYSHSTPY